ncbi:calmodulin-like isoform X4 [Daktulosphaira vitifoliae]|uniref:calmodulin-like isoform X4 n=1 Tax=Daktulosphaira vitifoliae TaxID=58002 RepID=UPI0021AA1A39|nr:calmodulin-like isoform X4 [Daktulosphaira vitifoliae]
MYNQIVLIFCIECIYIKSIGGIANDEPGPNFCDKCVAQNCHDTNCVQKTNPEKSFELKNEYAVSYNEETTVEIFRRYSNNDELQETFNEMDTDKFVNYGDIINEKELKHMRLEFNAFMHDKNGHIGPAELVQFWIKTGKLGDIEKAKNMISKFDINKDGAIDFNDFVYMKTQRSSERF